jgi:hypothetical protein
MVIQTTPVGTDFQTTVEERSGFQITLHNTALSTTLFRGHRDHLINISGNIEQFDMSINVNSAVVTYRRVDHLLSLYFNGVLLGEYPAPASYVDDVIDWSTSDNIYVNQFHKYTPANPTHYHKISVYDKILSQTGITKIYNATIE